MKHATVLSFEYVLILLITFSAIFIAYSSYKNIHSVFESEVNILSSIDDFERICRTANFLLIFSDNSSTEIKANIKNSEIKCIGNGLVLLTDKKCETDVKKYYNNIEIGEYKYSFTVVNNTTVQIQGKYYQSNNFAKLGDSIIYIFNFNQTENSINGYFFSKKNSIYIGCFNGKIAYVCGIFPTKCLVYCNGECRIKIFKQNGTIKIIS